MKIPPNFSRLVSTVETKLKLRIFQYLYPKNSYIILIKGELYHSRYAAILFRKQHYVSSQHRANMELLCKVEPQLCYSHCQQ